MSSYDKMELQVETLKGKELEDFYMEIFSEMDKEEEEQSISKNIEYLNAKDISDEQSNWKDNIEFDYSFSGRTKRMQHR